MEQPKPSILVRFPAELQLELIDQLRYQDAIMLSQVNRHFHKIIDPQKISSSEEKTAFVKQAQYFKHNDRYSSCDVGSKELLPRQANARVHGSPDRQV
ncbi:hypothetical protein LTR37_018103 [Vermiconidia calcicola]|uniref:Uncharacterized protein n=1 Tax=Vermiconidia calcicola TaxID=1690605 RepID=A0ACC3MKS5_9PEZI|nr:hypothetical protein LTR37_018103 [Vermiconidia calcicola]